MQKLDKKGYIKTDLSFKNMYFELFHSPYLRGSRGRMWELVLSPELAPGCLNDTLRSHLCGDFQRNEGEVWSPLSGGVNRAEINQMEVKGE